MAHRNAPFEIEKVKQPALIAALSPHHDPTSPPKPSTKRNHDSPIISTTFSTASVSLQVEMRSAGFSATTYQGIKNASAPAANVGARARRDLNAGAAVFRSVVDDPIAGCARPAPAPSSVTLAGIIIIDRPDRPSSIVAPNRNRPTPFR
jgi:hypothetical protein